MVLKIQLYSCYFVYRGLEKFKLKVGSYMDIKLNEKQMMRAVHILIQDDKEYNAGLVNDLTEEEYQRFLEECPEFLEDTE